MNNKHNIDKEKLEWMESIGATEMPEPVIYIAGPDFKYTFSEEYLKETPIEKIKEHYNWFLNGRK